MTIRTAEIELNPPLRCGTNGSSLLTLSNVRSTGVKKLNFYSLEDFELDLDLKPHEEPEVLIDAHVSNLPASLVRSIRNNKGWLADFRQGMKTTFNLTDEQVSTIRYSDFEALNDGDVSLIAPLRLFHIILRNASAASAS